MQDLQHSLQRAAFGLDPESARAPGMARRSNVLSGPVCLEIRGVEKVFRIPVRRFDSVRERVRRPLTRAEYRELRALRGVSFDVHRGEFFGIVGRNGSGKSTLLKILASIYRADAGRVRMAGRLAPFIELGVGFNTELTARENVVLNGVMMGLSRRQATRRLDAVLDFAELQPYVDLKLKNYSSGMLVRLAFSIMVGADADIMLVDEVLAVGDASFAQKCLDVFRDKRRHGTTLVLVTHDMATVQAFCDRALLIHDGEQRYLGDPEEAVLRYYRLNFSGDDGPSGARSDGLDAQLSDVWLEDERGERVENVRYGAPFTVNVLVLATRDLPGPAFVFALFNVDDTAVLGFGTTLEDDRGEREPLAAGQRVQLSARIENRLVPGRYSLSCTVARSPRQSDVALKDVRILDFLVQGVDPLPGMVSVEAVVDAVVEPAP